MSILPAINFRVSILHGTIFSKYCPRNAWIYFIRFYIQARIRNKEPNAGEFWISDGEWDKNDGIILPVPILPS